MARVAERLARLEGRSRGFGCAWPVVVMPGQSEDEACALAGINRAVVGDDALMFLRVRFYRSIDGRLGV